MNIPTYDTAPVTSNVLPTPQRSTSSPVASALQGLGGTMEHVGDQILNYKIEADKTFVKGQLASYNKDAVDLMNGDLKASGDPNKPDYKIEKGFLRTEGESAMHSVPQGLEALKQLRNKYLEEHITDPNQRRMFQQMTEDDAVTYDRDLQRHQFQQGQKLKELNSKALIDSYSIQAGLHYTDMNPGGQFEKDIAKIEDAVHDHLAGKLSATTPDGKPNPAYVESIRQATGPVYKEAIERLSDTEPLEAKKQLDALDNAGKINLNISQHLHHVLEPALEAYQVRSAVENVTSFPQDINQPFDRVTINKEIEAMGLKPKVEAHAKAEVKRREADFEDSKKKYYASNAGAIYMNYARQYWDKQQEAPVNEIRASKEFRALTNEEQEKVLDKVDAENWKLRSHRQTIEQQDRASRRQAAATEKAATTERRRQVIEEQHQEANYWRLHPEELATLSKEKVEALNVSHAEQKEIANMYKKVTQPKELRRHIVQSGTAKKILDKMPGLSEADKNKYLRSIESQAEKMDHAMTDDQIERAVTISMAQVAKTEKTKFYELGSSKKSNARAADVISPDDLAVITKLEEKRGSKLPDKQIKMLLQELADAKGAK